MRRCLAGLVKTGATTAVTGALGAALLVACLGKDIHNPGTSLGTFHVDGTLVTNACGASMAPPADWKFDVKLATDPHVLYWVQGDVPVQGSLESSHATMNASTSQVVHDVDSGAPFCQIDRADVLDITLSNDETSFTGAVLYTFSLGDGSVCDDQMASSGGPYTTLPCVVKYSLSGAKAR